MKDSLKNIKINVLAQDMRMCAFRKVKNGFEREDLVGESIGNIKKYAFVHDLHKIVGIGQNILDDFYIDTEILND